MKFTHEKDLKYNGIGFNAIWIRKHNESDFIAKCIVLFPKLNEKQAKELYAIANTNENGNNSGNVKAGKKR